MRSMQTLVFWDDTYEYENIIFPSEYAKYFFSFLIDFESFSMGRNQKNLPELVSRAYDNVFKLQGVINGATKLKIGN